VILRFDDIDFGDSQTGIQDAVGPKLTSIDKSGQAIPSVSGSFHPLSRATENEIESGYGVQ